MIAQATQRGVRDSKNLRWKPHEVLGGVPMVIYVYVTDVAIQQYISNRTIDWSDSNAGSDLG
jgi:hypothetical protein